MRKKGQNLVEFVFVIPLLIFLLLAIVELSLYWRTVLVVQEVALEAATAASKVYVSEKVSSNPAAESAYQIVMKRKNKINPAGFSLSPTTKGGAGPFNIQEYLDPAGCNPSTLHSCKAWLRVDYRDPYKRGVITQFGYRYNTMFMGIEFSIPRSDGAKKIVIIPKQIDISSTKIQQYITY